MSKILDMAKDFSEQSKKQAIAIEQQLKNDFKTHRLNIQAALKENEQQITRDINAQNQRLNRLVLKTWGWLVVTVILVITVSWGVIWWEGEMIVNRAQEIIKLEENIQELEKRGGRIQLSICGEKICIPVSKDDKGNWTRTSDGRKLFIPEGY